MSIIKQTILITLAVLGVFVSSIFIFLNFKNAEVVKSKDQTIDSLKNINVYANNLYSNTARSRDSCIYVNMQLSKYRALTDAMVYRDSIRKPLQYNIGDIVFLKRDSSRALVTDIVVGGGKFEHYIKYHIMFKDKSYEEIIPELLYEK